MPDGKEKVSFRELSDIELALIVKDGSNEAFEEMARRYIKFLYSLASGFSADGFDKSDFAQEGLLILFAACKTYNPRSGVSFKNYLALCVKRRYISIQKKSNAGGAIPAAHTVPIEDADERSDNSLNPEELLINKEYLKSLIARVEKNLSKLELNVLSRYLAGYAYAEISAELGLSAKAVDNALQRIRKKLNALPSE